MTERIRVVRLLAVTIAILALYAVLQLLGRWVCSTPVFAGGALVWLLRRPISAVLALVHLMRIGAASLLLGPWWIAGSSSQGAAWAALIAIIGVLGVAVVHAPGRRRDAIMACCLTCFACYILLAIARAPLDGELFHLTPAEVAVMPRYHYAALAFLTVALTLATDVVVRRPLILAVAWLLLLAAGHARHGMAVDLHGASREEVAHAFRDLQTRVAAVPSGHVAYVPNTPIHAFGWLPNTTQPPPGLAALFAITAPGDTMDGRTVRFVEENPVILDQARRRGGRAAALMVTAAPANPPAP